MPIFEVTSPDGRVIEVTAPDGATEEQAIKYAQDNWNELSKQSQPIKEEKKAPIGKQGFELTPERGSSNIGLVDRQVVESGLRGAALAGKAAYQGLSSVPSMLGEIAALPYNFPVRLSNEYLGTNFQESHPSRVFKAAEEKLYPVQAETVGERLSGDVIRSVSGAAGMIGTGGMLSKSGGEIGAFGQALATAPKMQYAGAATSGLSSGLTREAGGGEGAQLGAGLVGGLLPYGVGLTYGATRGVIGDVKQGLAVRKGNTAGQAKEAERFIQENAAGDPRTIQALEKAKIYIPSQKPTTSEALAQYKKETGEHTGTALIKIQDNITKLAGVGEGLKDISSKRSQSYGKIIDKIAGTKEEMEAAIKAREVATSKLYKIADNVAIPYSEEAKKLVARVPSEALTSAKKIAQMQGEKVSPISLSSGEKVITLEDFGITQNTKSIKGESLTSMLKGLKEIAYGKNTPSGEASAARGLIADFDDFLTRTNPSYKAANIRYAELSKPINRMDVGIVLREKLKNAADQDSYLNFMNAADDAAKTIKDATGFARFDKFNQVLNKSEINAIKAINKDMQRLAEVKSISSKTVMPSGKNLADQEAATLPPLLWRPATIANFILKASNKDASMEVNKQIANMLADPRRVAAIIKATPKDKLPEMLRNLRAFGMGGMEAATPMATDMTQGQQ